MPSQLPLARTGGPEDNFGVLLWEGCHRNVHVVLWSHTSLIEVKEDLND